MLEPEGHFGVGFKGCDHIRVIVLADKAKQFAGRRLSKHKVL